MLSNGVYLLTGPREFDPKDPWRDRPQRFEMFVLGEFIDEGPAVSRTRLHVAWTTPGQRDIYEADVSERLEPQDFRRPDEREPIFSCGSGTRTRWRYTG